MKKSQKKGMSKTQIAALGAGAAALGGAAYYFLGPKGRAHQKSAKKWTVDAKKKIVKKIERTRNMSESLYEDIIDDVVKPYIAKGTATAKEVVAFADDLKRDWKRIVDATEKTRRDVTKATKKVGKAASTGKNSRGRTS